MTEGKRLGRGEKKWVTRIRNDRVQREKKGDGILSLFSVSFALPIELWKRALKFVLRILNMNLPTEWKTLQFSSFHCLIRIGWRNIIITYVWSWADCEKQADNKIFEWPLVIAKHLYQIVYYSFDQNHDFKLWIIQQKRHTPIKGGDRFVLSLKYSCISGFASTCHNLLQATKQKWVNPSRSFLVWDVGLGLHEIKDALDHLGLLV